MSTDSKRVWRPNVDVDLIIDMAAYATWAASQGKKINVAADEITLILKQMMDDVDWQNREKIRHREYLLYVVAQNLVSGEILEYEGWLQLTDNLPHPTRRICDEMKACAYHYRKS